MAMTATQFAQYKTSQQNRYNDAHKNNDQDLIQRLEADAKRVGYTLNKPVTQPSVQKQATTAAQVKPIVASQNVDSPPKPSVDTNQLQKMAIAQLDNSVKSPVLNPVIPSTSTYTNTNKSVTDENKAIQNVLIGNNSSNTDTKNPMYSNVVSAVLKPQTTATPTNYSTYQTPTDMLDSFNKTYKIVTPTDTPSLAMKPSPTNPVLDYSPTYKQEVKAEDKQVVTETKPSFPAGSQPTTIKQPNGNLIEGYVLDGKTYYPNGTRMQEGDTTVIGGKEWRMGADGKGVEVTGDQLAGKQIVSSILGGITEGIQTGTGKQLDNSNSQIVSKKDQIDKEVNDAKNAQTASNGNGQVTPQTTADVSNQVTSSNENVTNEIKKQNEAVKEQVRANNNNSNQQVNQQSINQQNQTFNYDPQKDTLLQSILNVKPYQEQARAEFNPAPFNYDYNTDPVYQQALKNALSNAELSSKRASKGVLEMMNERGILNSSLTANQLAEIANQYLQQANSDIQTNLLPQLMQQAYARYRDNVGDQQFNVNRQDQLSNQNYQRYLDSLDLAQKQAQLAMNSRGQQFGEFQAGLDQSNKDRQLAMQEAGLTGNYNGKQTLESMLANRDFNLKKGQLLGSIDGQKTMDAMNADRNYQLDVNKQKLAQDQLAYEKQRNATLDTEEKKRWWANYERQGQEFAKQNSLDWAKLTQAQKEFIADQAYRADQLSQEQQKINWAKDPMNPSNVQRLDKAGVESTKDRDDWLSNQKNEFMDKLDKQEITYEDALKQIDRLEKSGIYKPGEANNVRNALKSYYVPPVPTDWGNVAKNVGKLELNATIPGLLYNVFSKGSGYKSLNK